MIGEGDEVGQKVGRGERKWASPCDLLQSLDYIAIVIDPCQTTPSYDVELPDVEAEGSIPEDWTGALNLKIKMNFVQ